MDWRREIRPAPHSFEAERHLLATVLHVPEIIGQIVDEIGLRNHHFSNDPMSRIYAAMMALYRQDRTITKAALEPVCEQIAELEEHGYADWLDGIYEELPTRTNGPEYARQIIDAYQRRQMIALGEDVIDFASDTSNVDIDAEQVVADLDMGLAKILDEGPNKRFQSIGAHTDRIMQRIHDIRSGALKDWILPTGLIDLDQRVHGMEPGELWIVAGRPGMGKTALALSIAETVAKQGKTVAFISLEMAVEQLQVRLIAMRARIAVTDVIEPTRLGEDEIRRFEGAAEAIETLPIQVFDGTDVLTLSGIRSAVAKLKRKFGCHLIVVDYIGLMRGETRMAQTNKVQEVAEISAGLKALAKEMKAPVLALSQLNRSVEHRDNKRPSLADLRDSGALEQDADKVLFVYREAYYKEREKPQRQADEMLPAFNNRMNEWHANFDTIRCQAEIIIAKNRQGPTDSIVVHFDPNTIAFTNAAKTGNGHV